MGYFLVVNAKTNQFIGVFDEGHASEFFVGIDVSFSGDVVKGGMSLVRDEYHVYDIELNKKRLDSKLIITKKEAGF